MTGPVEVDVRDAAATTGRSFGPGPWVEVTQGQVDEFASSTGDDQWIHVDAERAAAGPYGGTIAHGFLTLSLLPVLQRDLITWTHRSMGINYGLDKVRFLTPVMVGARVRLSLTVVAVTSKPEGAVLVALESTVEVEGAAKPACVATSLALMRPQA